MRFCLCVSGYVLPGGWTGSKWEYGSGGVDMWLCGYELLKDSQTHASSRFTVSNEHTRTDTQSQQCTWLAFYMHLYICSHFTFVSLLIHLTFGWPFYAPLCTILCFMHFSLCYYLYLSPCLLKINTCIIYLWHVYKWQRAKRRFHLVCCRSGERAARGFVLEKPMIPPSPPPIQERQAGAATPKQCECRKLHSLLFHKLV